MLEGGVDREQRVAAGEVGDPVQRAARADHEAHPPAPGDGLAVGLEQMPDGGAVAARGGGQVGDDNADARGERRSIWPATWSAAAASSRAGNVTMTGGPTASWPG